MRVLFLDIDGVLNSEKYARSLAKGGMLGIDPEAVRILDEILEATGAKIVLSSTWRLYPDLRADVRKNVGEFIDVTKSLRSGFRGDEIREWLERHPEVTEYAILDDDSDFYADQYLYKTRFATGLTPEIAKRVIRRFTND